MLENWHIRPVSFKHYQRFAADYSDGLLALMELLLRAAASKDAVAAESSGGEDEPEAHD
jgi:hypothetical protein